MVAPVNGTAGCFVAGGWKPLKRSNFEGGWKCGIGDCASNVPDRLGMGQLGVCLHCSRACRLGDEAGTHDANRWRSCQILVEEPATPYNATGSLPDLSRRSRVTCRGRLRFNMV